MTIHEQLNKINPLVFEKLRAKNCEKNNDRKKHYEKIRFSNRNGKP